MDSDTPSAAWHPAMMPNRSPEPRSVEHAPPSPSPSLRADEEAHHQDAPAAEPQENTQPEDTNATEFDDGDESDAAPGPNAAKHASTMSFARTSHEVSFDDDSEWNLQRSDTDPFNFMPPNERTNSFPVVPQLTSGPNGGEQTQSSLGSSDLVASGLRNQYEPTTLGGDRIGAEEEESDARFEEGLPLIPQAEPEPAPQTGDVPSDTPQSNFDDPFSQDDGGDDFFTQIHSSSEAQESPFEPALHRKSTTMVIREAMDPAAGAAEADSELPTPIEAMGAKVAEPEAVHDSVVRDGVDNTGGTPRDEAGLGLETEDLDAKWAAAFGDDDDDDGGGFLLDSAEPAKELDPADIFGSDDEGFLDDDAANTADAGPAASSDSQPQPTANNAHSQALPPSIGGRYTPTTLQESPQLVPNPYAPTPPTSQIPQASLHSGSVPPMATGYGVPPPPPSLPNAGQSRAQSFASKSKGGYQSPYDLPMDIVKPKKRSGMQQVTSIMPPNTSALVPPAGPPRSASMYAQVSPTGASNTSLSPPTSSHSNQKPPLASQKSTPQLRGTSSFFEDLPMKSRPRPASRQSNLASPPLQNPYGQLQAPPGGPPQGPPQGPPVAAPPMREQVANIPPLVAPERTNPFASLQQDSQPKPPAPPMPASNRYSPAPAQAPGASAMPPPALANRYSPAPPILRSSSAGYSAVPPPVLAHQPRTSSPLAHFESAHEHNVNKPLSPVTNDGPPLSRSISSQYEPRLTRIPSLPPTQEVEEEPSTRSSPVASGPPPATLPAASRYSPMQPQHSPPPMGIPSSNSLSPPKRSTSNYAPQPAATMPPKEVTFVPPPRSQTQSPGAVYGRTAGRPADPIPRPSSVQGPTSPRQVPATPMRTVRARGMSQHLNLVTPTDGRELDPLQRWQGAPCFSWGVGGVFVTSFPKDMPRYGINSAVPQITRSPGEIRMKHMKDVLPLEERLAKFPGPLKGKSKKKETLAWLATGIDLLEKSLPSVSFRQHVAHDEKRAVERVLLWKILRVFVENDGALGGTPAADNTVRDIISPGVDAANTAMSTAISSGVDLTGMSSPMTAMQADTVDSTAIEQIRRYLLSGDREKAVWAAADKRLWGHALLIANTSQSADLYKQVSREFIKKEVTHSGHGNESLAALYGVLSGNFEESVDELVPAHARAGLQMMPTSSAVGGSEDALAGLDKWRETLGLILSNRSQGDVQALRSLGNLLAEYGRAEAAHICYIFAGNFATFGGLSDSNASFVLLGADHRHQADQFGKQTEALQLSEVYEYGLSLAPGSNVPQSCPHLAAYKLQHAEILAEHGLRDKALQYCEGIYSAMNAQTKRSPYYNASLESSVYDFMRRLKQAPKEESSSWITKPKMDQVSNTMWNKFNKFVAGGDDDGENGAGGEAGAESGPFARVAGGTPTISRSPSISNFEIYGSSPNNPMVPATAASSRYAPGAAQAPASPYEPMNSYGRGSNDLPRPGAETQASYSSGYAPAPPTENGYLSPPGYQPSPSITTGASPYMPVSQDSPAAPATLQRTGDSFSGYQPYGTGLGLETPGVSQQFGTATPDSKEQQSAIESSAPTGYQPSYGGYGAPSMGTFESPSMQPESSGGYEPPSYEPSTFEPPSYQPGPADDDDVDNKRRKNMMDDDEDDMSALGGNGKTKAEKDRENEEMFRKVAEEEAKRAAEAKAASAKKGWGFGGWFGGGGSSKKEPAEQQQQQLNKPVKAKLGEASSFVYDPDLKRWINKKPGAENAPAKTATPPPPRANGRTPPPPGATSAPPPPPPPSAGPPSGQPSPRPPGLSKAFSQDTLGAAAAGGALLPPMARSFSSASAPGGPMTMPGSAPPSRPGTSLSNASSIDDLLSSAAAGPRKAGKKPRKSGRYVDVMAK